jgi:hypothetical protein
MLVKQDLQRDTEPSQTDWSHADLIAHETAIQVPIVRQLAGPEWARGSDAHLTSTDAPDGIVRSRPRARKRSAEPLRWRSLRSSVGVEPRASRGRALLYE